MLRIEIQKIYGNSVSSRQAARELLPNIPTSADTIEIDFAGVDFISRSFADQFIKEVEEFGESKITVLNASPQISKFFELVKKPKTQAPNLKEIYQGNQEEIGNLIFSLEI
ncbi:MAG: DUF4325 domain-containing protein [Bacteroidia bacterium]|nr:DUF4325 domain-containing protein [Bacteroidia bacterium]